MHIQDESHHTNYLLTGSGEFVSYEQDKNNKVPSGWLKYLLAQDVNPTNAAAGVSSFSATSEKMTVRLSLVRFGSCALCSALLCSVLCLLCSALLCLSSCQG